MGKLRMDGHTKVVVLTQMGVEIPESIYDEFLESRWVDRCTCYGDE